MYVTVRACVCVHVCTRVRAQVPREHRDIRSLDVGSGTESRFSAAAVCVLHR